MKKLVMFYSYTGTAKKLAHALAEKTGAELIEIKDKKRPGTLSAYIAGCFAAMRMRGSAIEPISAKLSAYDSIAVFSPVWAGHPAPPVVTLLKMLPKDMAVELSMVSASGESGGRARVEALLKEQGCRLMKYEDIKK